MNTVLESLKSEMIEFQEDIELSQLSYMKTGGIAKLLVLPKSSDEVSASIKILNNNAIKYKIIGATSNLLFLDEVDYSCLLSITNLKGISFDSQNNEISAYAGTMLADLSRFSLLKSVTGFEGLEGIPGTVGGAVFMNAGAYGYEIKNVLNSIEIIDEDGNGKLLPVEELGLKYRNSIFKQGLLKGVIVKANFDAKQGNVKAIESRMELFHAKRHKYQEFLYPNLGSTYSGSVYRVLGKKDPLFKVVSMVYFLLNYKIKLFRRESPLNRKWINDFAIKRFKFTYDKQPFSNKNINTLVNRGQGTDEMLRYINEIDKLANSKVPIENEIVQKF